MGRIAILFAFIVLCVSISSCAQVSYYYQAVKGQTQLLNKRHPVEHVLTDPDTPETLKLQLRKAEEIRLFGVHHLDLDHQDNFTQYADLDRKYAVWNVVAAPEFSIEPKTWCFPVAGCVAYKGFFDHALALREQKSLRGQGFDVLVYGVTAYSTLGWFDDPLLNTFIHFPENELAALLFHELAHQVLYVKDDSEFNEAFATAVEYAMLTRWLNAQGKSEQIDRIKAERDKQNRITKLILDFRQQLQTAYLGEDPASAKIRLFDQLKQEYAKIKARGEGTRYYDWWFSMPLNNASLLTVSTYFQLVPAFSSIIAEHDGDLQAFFEFSRALAKQPKEARDKTLERYLNL